MTLDEIMAKERFNEVEKELVKHPWLKHVERIKIISDIKIAKSNDRQSEKIISLTLIMAIIAGLGFTEDAIRGSSFPFPYNSIVYGAPIMVLFWVALFTLKRK